MNKKFIVPNKEIQILDTDSAPIELTLSPVIGKPQSIKNNGSSGNSVTVNYGANTYVMNDGNSATFIYDGDDWQIEKYYENGLAISHEWNGTELRIQNANETWGSFVDLQGPEGPEGPEGPQGIQGESSIPQWIPGTYASYFTVTYNDYIYVSMSDGNSDTPGTSDKWYRLGDIAKETYGISKLVANTHYGGNGILTSSGDLIVWGQKYGSSISGGLFDGDLDTDGTYTPMYVVQRPAGETGKLVQAEMWAYQGWLLYDTGNLYSHGYNNNGQLGFGDTTSRNFPELVMTDVVELIRPQNLSYEHSQHRVFIKKTDGKYYGTGYNGNGGLGVGDSTNRTSFTEIKETGGLAIDVERFWNFGGSYGSAWVLTTDGRILVTGYGGYGNHGDGLTSNLTYFTDVTSNWLEAGDTLLDIQQQCGYYSSSASAITSSWMLIEKADTTRIVKSSGYNAHGQLGDGTTTQRTTPVQVILIPTNIKSFHTMGGGLASGFVLTDDGKVWSWGYNSVGQLATGNTTNQSTPQLVYDGIDSAVSLFAVSQANTISYNASAWIRTESGRLFGAGRNNYGQLGLGSITDTYTFTEVAFDSDRFGPIVEINCNGYGDGLYYLFRSAKGYVFGTGYNGRRGLALNNYDTNYRSVLTLIEPGRIAITRGDKGEDGTDGQDGIGAQWTPGTYNKNDLAVNNGTLYVALETTTEEPSLTATTWKRFIEWGQKGMLHMQHTVSPGIDSGTVTAGMWNIGPLNTLKSNTITGASLDTGLNEFTLPAGKYKLTGFRGCFYTNAYATRLYNVTDGTTALIGMNGYADQGDGYNSEYIPIQGVIDIDSPKTFRFELYAQTTRANDGWGFDTNSYGGLDRVWSDILIEDISSIRGPKGEDGADGTTTVDTATGNFNVTGNLITKTVQMYNGDNSVNQKDVRLEMTPTGLQFNLYDDTGTFIRTILEQSYDTPTGGLLLSAPIYRKRWIGDALGVVWQADAERVIPYSWETLATFSATNYYGEYRVSAQLYGDSADCIYRILVNDIEVGRATHRGGYTTYTIDFEIEVGDKIEFQAYKTDNDLGDWAGVRYQKLICDSKSIVIDYFSPTPDV